MATGFYKVYAAIDFGTDGTGLAYSIPFKAEVYIHDKWKKWGKINNIDNDNDDNKDDPSKVKPRTAILLDRKGKFVSFGDIALQTYMNLKDNEMMLFEHFKMNLYSKPHYVDDDQKNNQPNNKPAVEFKTQLVASNGKQYPASAVFIEALKWLKNQAMHVFKRNKLQIKSTKEVCWILTVPAIWDDIAKAQMRKWAIAAKMIDPNLKDHLLLKYEPDCAALSIQYYLKKLKTKNFNNVRRGAQMLKNEVYCLVDAGGGTVDVACHKIIGKYAVKELLHPSGGAWGDMYVDEYFIAMLCDIFQNEWMEEFKKEEPNCYIELLNNFRRTKREFSQKKSYNVLLPIEFVEFMTDKVEANDDEIEEVVRDYILDGNANCFKLDDEMLTIDYNVWAKYFFDKLINPTINHIKKLLSHNNMKNCKHLCIVGGFGAIGYFQNKMKKQFGKRSKYKLNIIIPPRPILSVLDGAARMAKKKTFIRSRVLSKTYGIALRRTVDSARSLGVTETYIQKHKTFGWNEWRVANCFQVFAQKSQQIQLNQVITHGVERANNNTSRTSIRIYSTDETNPLTLDCAQELGTFIVKFDADDLSLDISVEFHFYDTTIKVAAYSKSTPDDKKEIKIQYATT